MVVLAAVVLSWIQLSPDNPAVRFTRAVVDPVLEPIRRLLPSFGLFVRPRTARRTRWRKAVSEPRTSRGAGTPARSASAPSCAIAAGSACADPNRGQPGHGGRCGQSAITRALEMTEHAP